VQLLDALFQRRKELAAGFDNQQLFIVLLDLALPTINRLNRAHAIDASSQLLADQGLSHAVSFFSRSHRDIDDDQFRHYQQSYNSAR
jgi:hypothetical protein